MGKEEIGTVCIGCSIFKLELEALKASGRLGFPLYFRDSGLHMDPSKLESHLTPLVEGELDEGRRVILVYGDCHAHMADLDARPCVARTVGINCCEILLGREAYRKGRREGAFFVLAEWAIRWREVFQTLLGLDRNNMEGLMQDMHSKLVYLDTGLVPIPTEELEAFSEYCGLPWEAMEVSLEPLLDSIQAAAACLDDASG